jgi:hypothetical protein
MSQPFSYFPFFFVWPSHPLSKPSKVLLAKQRTKAWRNKQFFCPIPPTFLSNKPSKLELQQIDTEVRISHGETKERRLQEAP